jgi:hypothetical protein
MNIASFLRTVHGKSTTAAELIKNVDLYRQASLYASSSTFPITGKEYICRISSSFRRITSLDLDNTPRVKLYQKISSSSSNLGSLWPHSIRSNITLYKTLFLNNLRFSADDFTTIRRSNDACVLYESRKNQYSIGFILCIGHLVEKNEIYLLLNKVNISSTADTLNIRGRTFKCTNIMQGTVVSESTIIINPSGIIQKLAFRPDHGKTETESNTFVFFQYPNIKESS